MTGADSLPSGRRAADAMTHDEVTRHQRSRMLHAMAGAVAESGYGPVTVADVIARAKVSRSTFYEQFTGKRDCFLAAYDLAASVLLAEVEVGAASGIGGGTSLCDLIAVYLEALAGHADFARVFLVEIYSLGADGLVRRRGSHERFIAVLAGFVHATSLADLFACEAFVSAVAMMVSLRMADADVDGIRALREPLHGLAVTLFGDRATGPVGTG